MHRKSLLLALSLSSVALAAHAQIGWTLPQIEAKYGKAINPYNPDIYSVMLAYDKYPTLVGGGYNSIKFEFYQGKVVTMNFDFELTYKTIKIPGKKKSDAPYIYPEATNKISETASLSYDDAKRFALAYIEDNANERAIQHELKKDRFESPSDPYGERLAGGTESLTTREFDYKGWHVDYYCRVYTRGDSSPAAATNSVTQTFEIKPASNNPIAKPFFAGQKQKADQTHASAEKASQQRQSADLKSETR